MSEIVNTILTVSELNQRAKMLLETQIGVVSITGEISNWVRASSGHCYFSLKDDSAQVRCAFFRGKASRINFQPENGQAVVARAQVSLYPNRGDYQLIVSSMEPAGQGQLAVLFARLKKKLLAEGLFAPEHKKPLPGMPQQIGVITSPTGAALQDILKVLKRRWPLAPIHVYPAQVQGQIAAATLCQALKQAVADNQCDVIILARGGGSMEDLWAFNDEALARLIFDCPIPIITGVGHEVDFTIADFTADVRAATPSAAAEQVAPDQAHIKNNLRTQLDQLLQIIQRKLDQAAALVQQQSAKLKHPRQLIQQQMQRLDFLALQLNQHITNRLNRTQTRLQHQANLLGQLSPHSTLKRGYAIIQNNKNEVVQSIDQVRAGEELTAEVFDGKINIIVST